MTNVTNLDDSLDIGIAHGDDFKSGLTDAEKETLDETHKKRREAYAEFSKGFQTYFAIPFAYAFSGAFGMATGYAFFDFLASKFRK
jgi:hypothetical protein